MSQRYYNNMWAESIEYLSLLEEEAIPEEVNIENHGVILEEMTILYLEYLKQARILAECYDQIVHPQKRLVLRKNVDNTIGRMLEIKHDIVNLQSSDMLCMEQALIIMKMTPEDAEVPVPHYILFDQRKALTTRSNFLRYLISKLPPHRNAEPKMSKSEAILLIQKHERARAGRHRFKLMKEVMMAETYKKDKLLNPYETITVDDQHKAAIKMQKVWRQKMYSQKIAKQRQEEFEWLEMIMPSTYWPFIEQRHDERCKVLQRIRQVNNDENYHKALTAVKERIREQEASNKRESLTALIRQWYVEFRKVHGIFPDIPDEEVGGSDDIFVEKTQEELDRIAEEELLKEQKRKEKEKQKDKPQMPPTVAVAKQMKKQERTIPKWERIESRFLQPLHESCELYNNFWRNRKMDANPKQIHDEKIIEADKRPEVYKEVRIQVDELMREELKNLKMVIDGEKIQKHLGKGSKSKKGKKQKKEKDITSHRVFEDIFEELVFMGIIKESKYVPLIDFVGEVGYISSTLRHLDKEPQINAGEIRRMIVEYAILPLGSQEIHEKSPLIKSLLLVGPESSGKKTLVDIICTETGANLIDLTATNIVGKYPGRDGLKMLLHLIFKVAKLIQPSVIFIGDCEQMFLRRVPKGDATEPTRLKKTLPKLIKKMITPEERIMLIGTTNKPQLSRSKNLYTLYDKIIMVPRPDYGSRRLIWEHFVTHRIGRGFLKKINTNFSSLAKLSDGYTSGAIINTIKAVLTESRMGRAKERPITSDEFIPHLARKSPVYSKEEEVLKNWYLGTPLMKKRTEALSIMQEERDKLLEEAIKAENDKKKKKRKR